MPDYDFQCDKCNCIREYTYSIHEKLPNKCPVCNSVLFRQILTVPNTKIVGPPRTVAEAAAQNAKRVGKEQMRLMAEENNARLQGFTGKLPDGAQLYDKSTFKTPPWRDGSMGTKPIDHVLTNAEVDATCKDLGINKELLSKRIKGKKSKR